MPFNFPDPAVATTATNPVTGASYQWKADPGKWVLTGGPAGSPNPPVTISLLPPEGPQKGDLWIHEETLIEYAWDGTQWFEVGSSCGGDSEEEEDLYHPFVNSFRLVAPDDFNGENGTATLLTNAYAAGDDSYLSPLVETIRFAYIDLNDRKPELALVGETIQLTPDNESETGSGTLYGELEVTAVKPGGSSITYDVDFDSNRSVIYTEGDIVHYRIAPRDIYVKKTGDTMTGALVMDDADKILMQDTKLDFLITGESLKDNNGDPVLDSEGKEKWDTSIDRFSHIESLPPRILRSDGTFGGDTSGPFGIRVEIDDGNTHRNRFVVGNRHGEAVTITGGTGPNVQFGTGFQGNQDPATGDPHWVNGQAGGVKITGIPTPTKENPEFRLAVNKRYVDERDEELRQEIIELEEEIDALAPSVERGKWRFTAVGTVANPGQFTMYDDAFGSGQPTGLFKSAKSIWFNTVDSDGVAHAFGDVDDGELLEIFVDGSPEYGLYEVVGQAHDETQGATSFWVIDVNFIRTLEDTTTVGPGELCRFKVFMAPTGGDASGFVMKSGDQMTGQLEFYHEQAGNSSNYNTPSQNTKDISFATKNTDNNVVSLVQLYQPGYTNTVVCSGSLVAKSSLYTSSYLYGLYYNSDGSAVAKIPRIYLRRSTNSSGSVTSEYGALQWGSFERLQWNTGGGSLKYGDESLLEWSNSRVVVNRIGTNVKYGFTIKGTQLDNYTSSSGIAGDLLRIYHAAGDSDADGIFYFGKITEDNHITTKKYVDDAIDDIEGDRLSASIEVDDSKTAYVKDFTGVGIQSDPFTWESTNQGQANSISRMVFNVFEDDIIHFKLNVSGEKKFDYARYVVNGSVVTEYKDTTETTPGTIHIDSKEVKAGDIIELQYRKDSSTNMRLDRTIFEYLYSEKGDSVGSVITATLPLHAAVSLKLENNSSQVNANDFYTCKNDNVYNGTYDQVFMPKSKIRSLMNIPASATKLLCFDFSGTWFNLNGPADYSRVSDRGVAKTINGVDGILVNLSNSVSYSKLSFIINLSNAIFAEFSVTDNLGEL